MAGPYSERQELEDLRKLKRLEELEAKAAGRPISAPAQVAPAQSSSPFIQKGLNMVQGAMQSPQMRASLPAPTEPDRMQNRTDSAVLAKARQVEADIANATRKARVAPVDRRAAEAGQAATMQQLEGMSPFVAGFGGANAAQIAGQSAGQQVYDEAGVMSPSGALTVRGLNSVLLGIPAMVNQDFREQVGQAGEDRPGESLAGDIAGYLLPGELAWQAGRGAYNATVKPVVNALLPKGGSAFARGTRLGQRGVEQTGAWAGQNALMQGTVGASTAAAEQGRPVTLEDIRSGIEAGATDPINVLGPAALMGLNRLGKFVSSGGRTATPDSVAAEIAGRTAGRSGDGSVLNAEALDGPVDRRAERILVRMLGEAGYRPNDIRAALASFDQLANQTTDLPTLTARLKDVLIDKLGERAENVLQKFLQGAGVSGGTASETVRRAVGQDYGRLDQFLEDSANARLGAGSRYDTLTAAEQEMSRIGKEGYDRVFSGAAGDPAAVDDLKQALDFFANSELASPLRQIAAGKMLNVEQMIASDPRRAAHWMQMAANTKAKEAFDAGNKVLGNAYTDMRDQILTRLENDSVAPGYRQARQQFGDEFGIEQAVTFGSRFFTKVTDTVGVRQLADDLRDLTPNQQEAALLSIRDELLRLSGRHRKGAPPVTTQIGNEQSLAGLETVIGEKGGQLANDIRFIDERLARLRRIDPVTGKSSTTPSREALEEANRVVSNPMMRRIGNVMEALGGDAAVSSVAASVGSGAGGAVLPIFSLRAGMRSMGNALARGRQGKIDDVTSLLLRDVGPQARPQMPGDDLPPLPSNRSTPANALSGQQQTPAPAQPRIPRNQRFETLRFMVQRQNPGLADDQIDALAEQQYRSLYERPAPGAQMTERDFAQGWERAVREAKQSLDETAGPGNYTAADVEAEAVASYSQTFPGGRGLPEDTMALPLTVAQDGARTTSRGRTYVFEVNGRAFTGATPEEAARRAGDLSPAMGNMENRPTVRKYAIEEDGTQVPYDEAIRSRPKAPPASPESEFARLVTAEQRLNTPARELSEGDLLRLAEPYARAYVAKGEQGASDIERAAYAVVQRMGGNPPGPIRAGGFAGFGGRKPPPERTIEEVARDIKGIEKQLRRKGYTLNEAETMVEDGTLPAELRGLMIQHGDLVRESGRLQDASSRAAGGVLRNPQYQRLESELNKASDDIANAEYEIANELRQMGYRIDGDDGEFMGIIDTLRREGKLSNYLSSRVEDLRAASTRYFDAEAKMKAMARGTSANGLSGLRTDLGNAAVGAGVGALGPAESPEERLRNMAIGAGVMGVGGRVSRSLGRNALAGETRTAGAPKTPQQAARYETPGSPEYEAAVAKGLDMSTAARMARAKEMGFDTETVLYHGTGADIQAFDASKSGSWGKGVYVTKDPKLAGVFAENRGGSPNIVPVYVRGKLAPESLASDLFDEATSQRVGVLEQKKWVQAELIKRGYDGIQAHSETVIFDPANIRSVNAAFDPDKAASPILTAGLGGGGRGPRKPKPDSPEAIKNALRDMAKAQPKEPTRLERMVEEGKDAAVPPADPVVGETNQLAAQATRMMERGDGVFKVHDKTGIVMIPYNGSNVPLYAPDIGPEEVIRRFYEALRLPAKDRPEWVRGVLSQAKAKPGLLLTERNIAPPDMVPPPASVTPEQPLPKDGIPYGAIAGGALAGALTGIGGGGAAIMGYQMLQDRNRPRNALAPQ